VHLRKFVAPLHAALDGAARRPYFWQIIGFGKMSDSSPTSSVERMFPFVIKSRILIIGRDTLQRSKSRLHFVLITLDISETSRAEVLKEFLHYPVVQRYAAVDLEKFFGIKGAKTIGFAKSGLAQSI
jgi:hypothetical protein